MSHLIRRAAKADQPAITAIVRAAGINPFSLHWVRFLVAEEGGQIVGVAQIKPHGDGSRELASLAVIPGRRGQGIGGALIEAFLAGERGTLYLMCRDQLEGYYERFGFRRLTPVEMPPYFRRVARVAGVFSFLSRLSRNPRHGIIMRREGTRSREDN
jgi:N-acetylglutamate synthase-like GNAT family acetyltransferase